MPCADRRLLFPRSPDRQRIWLPRQLLLSHRDLKKQTSNEQAQPQPLRDSVSFSPAAFRLSVAAVEMSLATLIGFPKTEEKQDFSLIDNAYVIDVETLAELVFTLNVN
ncbi:MAG: hypothetical protein AB4426_01755 [Xenococcaceae cyanobacterium]